MCGRDATQRNREKQMIRNYYSEKVEEKKTKNSENRVSKA